MKAPVILIGHRPYLCKSITKAVDLAKLLSELVPLKRCHSDGYAESWYEKEPDDEYDSLQIELKVSEQVRNAPRRLALPAPKRGSLRCTCGRGTVRPGEFCPSCNMPFHALAEAAQS
jgi:hypothetical protein